MNGSHIRDNFMPFLNEAASSGCSLRQQKTPVQSVNISAIYNDSEIKHIIFHLADILAKKLCY